MRIGQLKQMALGQVMTDPVQLNNLRLVCGVEQLSGTVNGLCNEQIVPHHHLLNRVLRTVVRLLKIQISNQIRKTSRRLKGVITWNITVAHSHQS